MPRTLELPPDLHQDGFQAGIKIKTLQSGRRGHAVTLNLPITLEADAELL